LLEELPMALSSGKEPLFFCNASPIQNFQQDPHQAILDLPITTSDSNMRFLETIDSRLAQTWGVLKVFCSMVSLATETGRMLPKEILLDTMASVLYGLTHIRFDTGSVDEAIKLGLLAFSSELFLQWTNIPLHSPYLSNAFRECLFKRKISNDISPQVLLWLWTVGSVSIFTPADNKWLNPWLRLNIDLCGVRSWAKCNPSWVH
jgi:hypothetical protein